MGLEKKNKKNIWTRPLFSGKSEDAQKKLCKKSGKRKPEKEIRKKKKN